MAVLRVEIDPIFFAGHDSFDGLFFLHVHCRFDYSLTEDARIAGSGEKCCLSDAEVDVVQNPLPTTSNIQPARTLYLYFSF